MTDTGQRVCPECMSLTSARICINDGSITIPAEKITVDGADPRIGRLLAGRYQIERKLGAGGMGSVYLAEQRPIGRKVALKFLHRRLMTDLTAVKRFQREARAVATLGHPNSIRLYDFGQTEDNELYLAMEYLEGEALSDVIETSAPLAAERIVSITSQVLQSLSEAHARGFVHRDIKPQNLFVSPMPGQMKEIVKVLDFGVAKMVEGDETTLTGAGMAVGSPRYMAPEQVRALPIDHRADLYALGGVIYEMLTGGPVFVRETASDLVMAHVKADPPTPTVHGRTLHGPLVDFMMRCLEKLPEDRPSSAADALVALAGLAKPIVSCGDGSPYPPAGRSGRVTKSAETVTDAGFDAVAYQAIPSEILPGETVRDEGERAYASTMEVDTPPEARALPSDFERVPSLMWQHRTPDGVRADRAAAAVLPGRSPARHTRQIVPDSRSQGSSASPASQRSPISEHAGRIPEPTVAMADAQGDGRRDSQTGQSAAAPLVHEYVPEPTEQLHQPSPSPRTEAAPAPIPRSGSAQVRPASSDPQAAQATVASLSPARNQMAPSAQALAAVEVLRRQNDPMEATTPLDPTSIDPELDKGTIPPPDMLLPGAAPGLNTQSHAGPPRVATPAAAFSLSDYQASETARRVKEQTRAEVGLSPRPQKPGAEPNDRRLYLLIVVASVIMAVIFGALAAAF